MTDNLVVGSFRGLGTTLAVALLAAGGMFALTPVDASDAGVPAAPGFDIPRPVSTCPVPAPATAQGYQQMFDGLDSAVWAGGDQGTSVDLGAGRVLWMYGDTLQTTPAGNRRFVHNSFLAQTEGCIAPVQTVPGQEVIPNAADGDFYWPQQAVVQQDWVVVFADRVRPTGNASLFEFEHRGTELALFRRNGGTLTFHSMAPTPSTGRGDPAPQWGRAVVADGRYQYVYAAARRVDGWAVYVARAPLGWVHEPQRCAFWDGQGWVREPRAAAPLKVEGLDGGSTVFSVDRGPDGFRMVIKPGGILGGRIKAGTATAPQGPFTLSTVADTARWDVDGAFTYNAVSHPWARTEGLLVSVSRNHGELAVQTSVDDLYKPRFLTVGRTRKK